MPRMNCKEKVFFFSKLDLANAFNQIKIREKFIKKTAAATPVGLFEYLYILSGLCGAAQTFIDKVLRGLSRKNPDGTISDVTYFAYVNDILFNRKMEINMKEISQSCFKNEADK